MSLMSPELTSMKEMYFHRFVTTPLLVLVSPLLITAEIAMSIFKRDFANIPLVFKDAKKTYSETLGFIIHGELR